MRVLVVTNMHLSGNLELGRRAGRIVACCRPRRGHDLFQRGSPRIARG